MKQIPMLAACVSLFFLTLGAYVPEVLANANKTDYCFRCHSLDATTDTTPATIVTSLNGTVGTSIIVAPGDSFELDYKVTNISGSTQKNAVAVGVALPHFSDPGTYTTALTTLWSIGPGTFIPSNITEWNNAWDQGTGGIGGANHYNLRGDFFGQTTLANFTDAYPVLQGIDHSDGTQTSVWGVGGGTKAAVDDGVVGNGDLDGTLNTMGNDATITVPVDTPDGVYTIAAYMIGHLESGAGQGFVKQEITVTVLSGGDTTPPSITTTIPAASATGVTNNSQVTINWNEPIDCATVNNTNITFTSGTGALALNTCLGSQAIFDVSGQTVGAQQVTVSTAVKDVAGNSMASNYQFFYTTVAGGDVTPPTISSTFPTNGATGVALDGLVNIVFNENINCATVNTTNITSDSPGWSLASCGGTTASFNTLGQANGTVYNVNVTTAVTDVAGNPLSAAYPFSFTTVASANNPPTDPINLTQFLLDGTTPITVGGYTTEAQVVFNSNITDPDGADTVKLQIDTDSNGTMDCESALVGQAVNYKLTCPLADGSYNWQARTGDNSGAFSNWVPFNAANPDFIKDASAPVDGTLTATPGDTQVVLTWTAATDAHSGLLSPIYAVAKSTVSAAAADCAAPLTTIDLFTYTDNAVANGTTYYYRVCATNNATLQSTGTTDSAIPAAGCLPAQPTVSIAPGAQTIPNDGGLVVYTVTVTNNDSACADATFGLSANDTNGTEFYSSVLSKTSMTIASGAFDTATVAVQMIPGNDAVTNDTTVTATDSPTHDPPVASAAVTTTVTLAGGCVGTGTNSNATAGGTLITGR